MKKLMLLFLICSLFVVACHKKAVPEITSRTEFPTPPKSAQLPMAENTPEAMAAGKAIFETKCATCHELKDTKIYTSERWTAILKTMMPRAKLNDEEAKQVTLYVITNAKK